MKSNTYLTHCNIHLFSHAFQLGTLWYPQHQMHFNNGSPMDHALLFSKKVIRQHTQHTCTYKGPILTSECLSLSWSLTWELSHYTRPLDQDQIYLPPKACNNRWRTELYRCSSTSPCRSICLNRRLTTARCASLPLALLAFCKKANIAVEHQYISIKKGSYLQF